MLSTSIKNNVLDSQIKRSNFCTYYLKQIRNEQNMLSNC